MEGGKKKKKEDDKRKGHAGRHQFAWSSSSAFHVFCHYTNGKKKEKGREREEDYKGVRALTIFSSAFSFFKKRGRGKGERGERKSSEGGADRGYANTPWVITYPFRKNTLRRKEEGGGEEEAKGHPSRSLCIDGRNTFSSNYNIQTILLVHMPREKRREKGRKRGGRERGEERRIGESLNREFACPTFSVKSLRSKGKKKREEKEKPRNEAR